MQIPGLSADRVDAIWDTVCFIGASGEQFKTGDIINALCKYHSDRATQKAWDLNWNLFKCWALANPNEFHGPASRLEQIGFGRYRLADNPE